MINTHGFVAQLVEQLTLNQLVESSSLSKPTILKDLTRGLFFVEIILARIAHFSSHTIQESLSKFILKKLQTSLFFIV